ncbi:BRCT domain-containing protein [Bdellovibrio sp. HCB185ZH]|uniref:BRCT domain-containing protein n=1 Tax=Bdellovibrio sp. HCB185ZH TaxID=3394235 RepID=UPI0039A58484
MRTNRKHQETYLHGNAAASTALTTLKGIIEGVICDSKINDLERASILDWIEEYKFLNMHPAVGSVFDYLAEALADDVLSIEEAKDIKWMIEKNLSSYYDESTQKMQTLLGLLSGIAADSEINAIEFTHLWKWLNDNEDLKGLFPFDEIYSIVCQIGTRRSMTDQEKNFLVSAFRWTDQESALKNSPFFQWEIDPEVQFENRSFCITGVSPRTGRSEIEKAITEKKGITSSRVTLKLDYLVVCAEPNRAWTHACYGRKIEEAVQLRRKGQRVSIISEADLWDALQT